MLNRWSADRVSVTSGDSTMSGASTQRHSRARQGRRGVVAIGGEAAGRACFGSSMISAVTKKQRPRRVESCERRVGCKVRNVADLATPARFLPSQRDPLPVAVRPGESSFRPDIEGLRAVAVLLVVAAHAGVPRLAGGYVGVDVFFVISGFLITSLLLRE